MGSDANLTKGSVKSFKGKAAMDPTRMHPIEIMPCIETDEDDAEANDLKINTNESINDVGYLHVNKNKSAFVHGEAKDFFSTKKSPPKVVVNEVEHIL